MQARWRCRPYQQGLPRTVAVTASEHGARSVLAFEDNYYLVGRPASMLMLWYLD